MEDIQVTLQQGGMIEFEKTGIFPEYLIFHSPSLKISWRFKLASNPQKGTLKVKGVKTFGYEFFDNGCKLRKVENGVPVSPWHEVEEMIVEMCD